MRKRLVFCSDGTWQNADQPFPTNVAKIANAVSAVGSDGMIQIVRYDEGVGNGNFLARIGGGAFGKGLEKNVRDGYRFLINNYQEEDQIFLFGFSRGAFTVRSLAGMIRNSGLLRKRHADRFGEAFDLYLDRDVHPDDPQAVEFRRRHSHQPDIHFIGVWDTVGSRGIPLRTLNWITKEKYRFHDVELSGSVKNAFHALAIDERRGPFEATLWSNDPKPGQRLEQVWFAGTHSNVGGGEQRDAGLSDITLGWMLDKAESCGLTVERDHLGLQPDPHGGIINSKTGFYRLTLGGDRPIGRFSTESVSAEALRRYEEDEDYRPSNLVEYLDRTAAAPQPA